MKPLSYILCCLWALTLGAREKDPGDVFKPLYHQNKENFPGSLRLSSEYEVIQDKANLSFFLPSLAKRNTLKLRLKNGLEVYLISDPSAVQSAAALSIEAGSWNDPESFPGMAHFVEHLLFMGTKPFPAESEYAQYIVERGGEYNALTDHCKTVYGFCINHENLAGALRRFSHFFKDPIFSASAIEREMHAVDHEFTDHIENDVMRIWRILKETGNPHHPNAVFSCGNLHSLSSVTQRDVQEWFSSHYLGHFMHLVLLSRLPIHEQVKLVVECFSSIHDEEKEKEVFLESMTSDRQKGHMIHLTPSYKNRTLQLVWEVPREFAEANSSRAIELVQIALDHGGSHSLEKVLESERLATEVAIDFWKIEKDHILFLIDVALTKKGVQEVDTVILRCFQAISKLKETGVPEYLFERLYQSERQLAEYISPHSPFDFVMHTAVEMIYEELDTYPEKTCLPSPFDRDFTFKFIHSLDPGSCIFFLVANPEETGVHCNSIEKWMGSSYFIREIPKEKLEFWEQISPHPLIDIRTDDYQEKNDSLISFEEEGEESADMVVIEDDALANVRLAFLEESKSDTVGCFFCFTTPFFNSSLKNAALSSIFLSYLEDQVNHSFPQEKKTPFYWMIVPGESELYLFLKIKRPYMEEKLGEFFSIFKNLKFDQETFEKYKQECIEKDPGDPAPLEYARFLAQSFLTPTAYTERDIYQKIPSLVYEDFVPFAQHFFDKLYIEAIFYGNLSKENVLEYWEKVKQILHPEVYIAKENEEPPVFSFSTVESPLLIRQKTHRKGSALLLLMETAPFTKERWAIQRIISLVLQQEFFEELRTKQQTAYRLYTWEESHRDKLLQYFAIQSSTHHPQDLLYRIEQFLEDFTKNFETKVTRARIEIIRQTLIATLTRQIQALESKEDRKWASASIQNLKTVEYEKILKFMKESFSSSNKKRLAIFVEGTEQKDEAVFFPNTKLQYQYIQNEK